MNQYRLIVFACCLSLVGCMRTAKPTIPTLADCRIYKSNEPIDFSFPEFDQQLMNFKSSNYETDVIAIKIIPGKRENILKRFIQDSDGYALITLINEKKDSIRLNEENATAFMATVTSVSNAHYSVSDNNRTGHDPLIGLLVRNKNNTRSSYSLQTQFRCSIDSINNQVEAGYRVAQYLLRL